MRNSSTRVLPRPPWQNPRVHLLDDVWLLTILAILVAIGVPSLSGELNVQIGTASWGLLALGAVHVAFIALAHPTHSPGRWRSALLTLFNAVGVITIGIIWVHVGGVQNPLFLAVFVLPVLGSIFLSRWHPFLIATLSILTVAGAALRESPELRSYVSGLVGGNAWPPILFSGSEPEGSFAGFYAPTSYLLVMLEIFAVALIACAIAAKYVGSIFERLLAGSILAHTESEQAQALWSTLIERMPLPALLVDPHSLRIISCSDAALAYLSRNDGSLEGLELFSVARFSFADLVQDMVAGAKNEPVLIAVHIGEQLRLTQVKVLQMVHRRRRLALLTLEDVTQAFCFKAALDSSEYAALVVDAQGRVRAFNRRAGELFSDLAAGIDVDRLLVYRVAGLPWWEPGLGGRRKMHLDIGSRIYEVTSSEVPVPGEEQRLYSVSLLPVALAAPLDKAAQGSGPPGSLGSSQRRLP